MGHSGLWGTVHTDRFGIKLSKKIKAFLPNKSIKYDSFPTIVNGIDFHFYITFLGRYSKVTYFPRNCGHTEIHTTDCRDSILHIEFLLLLTYAGVRNSVVQGFHSQHGQRQSK